MLEIASQIVLCLILAALLGATLGYLYAKMRCKNNEGEGALSTPKLKEAQPLLLVRPDGSQDDLKIISGIGEKLEAELNKLGIFHLKQIAEWSPENIKWLDNLFDFKGRVTREKWVEQAKHLIEQKVLEA